MDFLKNNKLIITIISILVLSLLGYIFFYIYGEKNDIEILEEPIEEFEEIKTHTIFIDIGGEVINPGLYELDEGSRVNDAINKAGGLTEEADLTDVNLAYILIDGLKIVIPSKETKNANIYSSLTSSSGKKININTATKNDFCSLNGIGESTAEKIINYRKEQGFFKNIEGLKNVPGIGEAKFNQIKEYVTIW